MGKTCQLLFAAMTGKWNFSDNVVALYVVILTPSTKPWAHAQVKKI